MRTLHRTIIAAVCCIGLIAVVPTVLSVASPKNLPSSKKATIELGWDAPTPDWLKANITTMEQRPFDGMMVNLHAGKTFMNKKPYPESAFTQDRADLAAVSSSKLNQNFITMWSAREAGWDWFSDADWAAAETNARNFAKTAKFGKVQGFMFDPEPYGTNPWSYSAELYPKQSFVSVQSKVRQRGAAFLTAVQAEMPNVKILTLMGLSVVRSQALDGGNLEKATWALWASFIDGMLDVIGPKVELIDGNEGSYYYRTPADFDAFKTEKQQSREYVSPKNRATYDKRVSIASSVFVDGDLNLLNSPRFFGFYLPTDSERLQFLEHNLFHALRTSDRYVWVYNEHMDWWGSQGKGVRLPNGLEAAIASARKKNADRKPLGFDVTASVATADAKYRARVELDGRVSTNGIGTEGTGLGEVALTTEFMLDGSDTACEYSKPDGYYQCFVPPGWNGRITPVLKGYTFSPPFFQADRVTKNNFNVDFEAKKV
jgi:hypothetical protein